MLMLDNGKHVLCEKPLCINEKQVVTLISHAKTKKLFLMEAIWSRFFPAYEYLRETLDCGRLGTIEELNINFGFNGWGTVDRIKKKSLGGGTLLDLGIYTIQFSQLIFKEQPIAIEAKGILNDNGVDLQMKATLIYSENRKASIKTSGIKHLDNIAYVKGTTGSLKVHDFWCPTKITDSDGTLKEFKLPPHKYSDYNFPNSAGLHYQAQEVKKCIRKGLLECPIVSHNESIIISRIEDEIRYKIGVKFPEDEIC